MPFISRERMETILAELCDELPKEFFRELNLGVVLADECKMNAKSTPEIPLYILGQYSRNSMGRQIFIYYGSYREAFANYSEAALKQRLRETLRHEFRHHLEYLAGEKDLEIEDARDIDRYLHGSR